MNSWSWAPMTTSNSAYGNFPINLKAGASGVSTNTQNFMSDPQQLLQQQAQMQLQQQQQIIQQQQQPQFAPYHFQPPQQPVSSGQGHGGQNHNHVQNQGHGGQNHNYVQNQSQGQMGQNPTAAEQEPQVEYLTGADAMAVLKKIDPNYQFMYQYPDPGAPGSGSRSGSEPVSQKMMPMMMEVGSGESMYNNQHQHQAQQQQQQPQQQSASSEVKVQNAEPNSNPQGKQTKNVAFADGPNADKTTKRLYKARSYAGSRQIPPQQLATSVYQMPPLARPTPSPSSPSVHPQNPQNSHTHAKALSSQVRRMNNKKLNFKLCGKCSKCKMIQGESPTPSQSNLVNHQNNSNVRGGSSPSGNLAVQSRHVPGHGLVRAGGPLGRGHSATIFPR